MPDYGGAVHHARNPPPHLLWSTLAGIITFSRRCDNGQSSSFFVREKRHTQMGLLVQDELDINVRGVKHVEDLVGCVCSGHPTDIGLVGT
jgi:hypothetical protein